MELHGETRLQQVTSLSRHLIQSIETERAALARELHDKLGSSLTVITMDISIVAQKLKDTDPELAKHLQRAIAMIKDTVALKRRMIEELRPSMLDSLGLSVCLTEHAREFEKHSGLKVIADIGEDFNDMPTDYAITIFRVAEESLTNAARHSGAGKIWISLQRRNGEVCLLVEDDGSGIAPEAIYGVASCGLSEMRERMAMLGGTLAIHQRVNGGGTSVAAALLLP